MTIKLFRCMFKMVKNKEFYVFFSLLSLSFTTYSQFIISVDDFDGDTVAIGAPFNTGNGEYLGHIRIFDWKSMVNYVLD